MEAICALHVPSIFSYLQSIAEDRTGESSRNYHCAITANPNVVAFLDENADRQSSTTTQKKESAVSSEQSRFSVCIQNWSCWCATCLEIHWKPRNFDRSLKTHYAVLETGHHNPVPKLLQKWESFCCRRKINPLQATLHDGINFRGDLFAAGVGYSCINTARSALSSIIVLPGSVNFGSHMLVTRFVKGVFERRPSLRRYKEIWDINSVLKVLATGTLGVDLSLRDTSWKLTMLFALLSSQRVKALKALTLTSMTLIANKCVFTSWNTTEDHSAGQAPRSNWVFDIRAWPEHECFTTFASL